MEMCEPELVRFVERLRPFGRIKDESVLVMVTIEELISGSS